MAKAQVNDEIVLLRHAVRQARVCVVSKLIKEAKLLQKKHGTETQRQKYRRKANKLIAEVYALKTIKDDEISKFGILNESKMNDILQDQSLSISDRIIARIVHYKTLHGKLMQFREEFPDFKKYFTGEKEKIKMSKNKGITKDKSSKKSDSRVADKSLKKRKVNTVERILNDSRVTEMEENEVLKARCNSYKRKKLNENNMEQGKFEKDSMLEDEIVNEKLRIIKPCSVTKEAMVKRFVQLLEEQKSTQDTQLSTGNTDLAHSVIVQAKSTDDFFITGNDSENCVRHKRDANFNKIKKYAKQEKTSTKIDQNNRNNLNNNVEKNADLHPSWLAKKKQQEMLNRGFQGKKIVFANN